MTKLQSILNDIDKLELADLKVILKEVKLKIEMTNKIDNILDDFIGDGKGFWGKED